MSNRDVSRARRWAVFGAHSRHATRLRAQRGEGSIWVHRRQVLARSRRNQRGSERARQQGLQRRQRTAESQRGGGEARTSHRSRARAFRRVGRDDDRLALVVQLRRIDEPIASSRRPVSAQGISERSRVVDRARAQSTADDRRHDRDAIDLLEHVAHRHAVSSHSANADLFALPRAAHQRSRLDQARARRGGERMQRIIRGTQRITQ